MAIRLTAEQALRMGLIEAKTKGGGSKKNSREAITDRIERINSSIATMHKTEDGYIVEITGEPVPSWNVVLRWDTKREFPSYNKAWHQKIYEAALDANLHREKQTGCFHINIAVHRKRLLDYDNICVKQMIDGIVNSGLIKDDSPKFITGYTVKQYPAMFNKTTIQLKRENSHSQSNF